MGYYKTKQDQTILDVCLKLYGNLDNLIPMLKNNGINPNDVIKAGTQIYYPDGTTLQKVDPVTGYYVPPAPTPPWPTPTYLPPVTAGLVVCQVAFDTVKLPNPALDNHMNPWHSRLSGAYGVENPGGSSSSRVAMGGAYGINGLRAQYYGLQELNGLTTPFYIGEVNYGITSFGTTQGVTVFVITQLRGNPYPAGTTKGIITQVDSNPSSTTGLRIYYEAGNLICEMKGNVGLSQISAPMTLGQPLILSTIFDKSQPAGQEIRGWINGEAGYFITTSSANNTNNLVNASFSPSFGYGGYPLGINNFYDGYIGCVLYYKRVLSTYERQQVENWLKILYHFP